MTRIKLREYIPGQGFYLWGQVLDRPDRLHMGDNVDMTNVTLWTGLKDKKGHDIFVKDIVQNDDNLDWDGNLIAEGELKLVEWEDGQFPPFTDSCGCCQPVGFRADECTIVGNIYENKELLNEVES